MPTLPNFPGISPNQFPDIKIRNQQETLVICASARCVWDDLKKINWSSHDIMCVNDLVMHFPGVVKHAYSNDRHMLPRWVAARRPQYVDKFPGDIYVHTCNGGEGLYVWPFPGHGTSSLNAVYVGLAMGYENIILAGMPLDNSGHYFDPPIGWDSQVYSNFSNEVADRDGLPRYWDMAAKDIFGGRVKSLSGRTKDLLG